MRCIYHYSAKATDKCSRCKKPICDSCRQISEEDGSVYCISCARSGTRKLQQNRIEKWLKQAAKRQKRAYIINKPCNFHPDKDAEAICTSCELPLCYSCIHSDKNLTQKVFCKECWKAFLISPEGMKLISSVSTPRITKELSLKNTPSIVIKDEPRFKNRLTSPPDKIKEIVPERKSIKKLVNTLRNEPSPAHRRVAAMLLGKSKDTRALDPLLYVLQNDTDVSVRKHVSEAILELNNSEALGPLLYALKSEGNAEVRKSIAVAYSRIKYGSEK